MPPDWEAGRCRYLTVSWIQFATTWSALALFLLALFLLALLLLALVAA